MFCFTRLLAYHHMLVCHSFHMWISLLYIVCMRQLLYWNFVLIFHAKSRSISKTHWHKIWYNQKTNHCIRSLLSCLSFMFGFKRLLAYHMLVCHSFHMWISLLYIVCMRQLLYWNFVLIFHAKSRSISKTHWHKIWYSQTTSHSIRSLLSCDVSIAIWFHV